MDDEGFAGTRTLDPVDPVDAPEAGRFRRVPRFRDALKAKQQAKSYTRTQDRDFLAALRACTTLDEVRTLRKAHHAPLPRWRDVALTRALAHLA